MAQKVFALLIVCLTLTIGTPYGALRQVNYLEKSKSLNTACYKVDSASVISDFIYLDSIAKLQITQGKGLFYTDFAMNYYYKYMLWHRSSDQDSCIKFSQIAWEQCHDLRALWILSLNLIHSGQHQEGVMYLEAFITESECEGVPIYYVQISRLFKKAYNTAVGRTE